MKNRFSFWLIPLVILLTGCSTRVSTHHRHHDHHAGHHKHVSVGVHTRTSGAGILGALIVGGIINSIIHDRQHQDHQQHDDQESTSLESESLESKSLESKSLDSESGQQSDSDAEALINGYAIESQGESGSTEQSQDAMADEEYSTAKQQQSKPVQWYQVGQDGKCYLMAVNNGVTDVVSAVPDSNCDQ